MASINEDGKLYSCRATYVAESIESRTNSPARVKNIIHKNHCSVFDPEGRNTRWHQRSWRFEAKVIAKECCIQSSHLYWGSFNFFNQLSQTERQMRTAGWDSKQCN
jgi:hypothetical protein